MADPNTRQGKRTPVTLKIKFKSETLEQFIERYAVDVSQGGIFIRTKEPLAVGTQMKFEFQLRDASPLIAGEGTVVWTRENDPSRPAIAPGMGVRFDRLADGSQSVLEKILAEKAKQAPQRGANEQQTKPPMFADTPTRVAPAPVQDALLGNKSGRTRADSQETPLPKPMPFHSDADEFGAEAFEEATKVRSLDELVAQTAAAEGSSAAAELTRGRRDSGGGVPQAVPGVDRDSAPRLPSPPEASGRTGKLLDTSPSPRDAGPARTSSPSVQPANVPAQATRLGLEPAKATTGRYEPTDRVPASRAVAAEPTAPVPRRPSSAPIVIGIMFTVAVAVVAIWYFVLRDHVAEEVANNAGGSGSALATNPGSNGSALGSNGSAAIAMVGSNGSATAVPTAPIVETEIASNVAKATVTVVDTDQTGPAPFKAKLEKAKAYKVRVEAPGYAKLELDVKGGQDKATAKLVAKPHVISVASEPSGAMIYIDNAPTGKRTPSEIELTAAQAAKKSVHVQLRLGGYRLADQMLDASAMTDGDATMTGSVDAKLVVAPVVVIHNPPPNTGSGSGSATVIAPDGAGSGAGSAVPSGTGSATPASGSASGGAPGGASGGGGGGGGSAVTPPTGGESKTGSGGEPEPDWSKKTP
ncbi:MAG: TIGR02266 family protein [Kofleriaceae bacterium]